MCWKEFVLKSVKTEDQELSGNLPNIEKLFGHNATKTTQYVVVQVM